MRALKLLGFLYVALCASGQEYVISTVAGGAPPFTPAPAALSSVGDPTRMVADTAGNVYFSALHSVFKVSATGALTRVAGNGRPGNSGDGGAAAAAQLSFPMGLALDAAGNVYVADRDANVVRKVTPNGAIQTVAGTGVAGYTGDGGLAINAQINGPFGVALDAAGNLYIADTQNGTVRAVAPDGTISTVAGTGIRGYAGDGGPALNAQLNGPEALAVDATGSLFIADTFNGRIRRVGPDGVISTVAGVGSTGVYSGDGGPATAAALSLPTDLAIDQNGNLYIADFGNSLVRVVTNGVITSVAGGLGASALANGLAAINARLTGPTGVAVDASGNVYFVEAGLGSGTGLAVGDYRIWTITPAGLIATLAGNGLPSFSGDAGTAVLAQLDTPIGVAANPAGGLLIADSQNQRVRGTTPIGAIATLAGTGTAGFNGDYRSPATALLNNPHGLAVDAKGYWYVADTGNNRIREIQPGGNILTVAGNGNASYFGDGGSALQASVNHPEGVAIDAAGNVYIADTLNNAVRKVSPDGLIVTFAGNGNPGYTGDHGQATQAHLTQPRGVAVDTKGVVYIADTGNGQIRRVDLAGVITTVDTAGLLKNPSGVAVDANGIVYIADTGNNIVRGIATSGSMVNIAGTGTCCYSGDGGIAIFAQLNQPWGIAVDAAGNVYIADSGNNAVRRLALVSSGVSVAAVTNGASNLPGAIAPGEVVVLYGTGLAGTPAVLFNGIQGSLLYATPLQAAAIVPYEVTGSSVQVSFEAALASAPPVVVPLAAMAPGVFTADGSGRGQAAALNQDASQNSAFNPAAPGSVLTLYVTGEGQTTPPGVDGKLGAPPLPQPLAPVAVTIGGIPVQVQYAGGAPGLIAGVMQVNVTVPPFAIGVAPVVVTVGGVPSQSGVTVVVR